MTPTDLELVLELIRQAHSQSSSPHSAMDEKRFYDFQHLASLVFVAWEDPSPDYEWNTDRVELFEDIVGDDRYQALSDGSPLTPEEEEHFRSAAKKEAMGQQGWTAYLYRLGAPPESGEERVVFFTWSFVIYSSQAADNNYFGGPFTEVIQAAQYVADTDGIPDNWHFEEEFPEKPLLEHWLVESAS